MNVAELILEANRKGKALQSVEAYDTASGESYEVHSVAIGDDDRLLVAFTSADDDGTDNET